MNTSFFKHFQPGSSNTINPPATITKIKSVENKLQIDLPQDYKSFLLLTNGFEGLLGESYVSFVPVEEIYENTQECCSEFFPWAIFIGSNRNVEMYIIDLRQKPYQFGMLPFIADDNDFIPLGETFDKLVTRLAEGTAFNKQ